ncbi:CDP-alcohol phosphatidyltransferase family protein [Clostridium sp. WILCCON 0269]|uniref:CDP-alcohol phosphatidyltransferase family protein n=1 Tax=Candidatus Clostridium eludens TaxID=3381663 RepID=A0ABW8SLK8_9CLOT
MIRNISVNALTLSRVPLSLMFCAVVLFDASPFLPCAVLFVLIAASDYLDGKLARKFGVQTSAGAIMDVMVDFFFIVMACLSLSFRSLFPRWMLTVIICKFLEFLITSIIFNIDRDDKNTIVFLFDPLGRMVVVLFYLLPILMLLLPLCLSDVAHQSALIVVCTGIAGLAALSSIWRISLVVNFQ